MTVSSPEPRAILESFIVDNVDLEELEAKLAQFNIFEAIGVVRQEIRHSNFLAFLLNPSQNHKLEDVFLKRFLKRVLLEPYEPEDLKYLKISPVDIDIADFSDVEIRREWKNIDILIQSSSNKLVCAVENKVDSSEHSNQLEKYREILEEEYKDYQIILIYLTPDGDEPSQKDWRAYSYSKLVEIIESICTSYKSTLGTDIYTLMTHYSTLLRRHIVSDSKVAELCRKIYKKHKQALDLIFEHRPDLQLEMSERITNFVNQYITSHNLYVIRWSKKYIDFGDIEWENKKLPLAFHFENGNSYLITRLLIRPCEDKTVRERIHQISRENSKVFKSKKLTNQWTTIYQKTILNQSDYENADVDELMEKFQLFWDDFVKNDFTKIQSIFHTNMDRIVTSE
ncbi:PDDEXK-like family protein [Anabaena azotica]|uniref:PD-(D/E)XK nuclease family protein n=1 Tax=Anabaena azotica FACHB-119 TaxID=947527 RepID=A0ABR8CXK9_9NOST|nr:PD-(D/E)XK nuclease family protein [Anabaena azotica]MBD2499675.1 PD-(D/E)XK nuclease family protein [Anabaena azotica FACHB-119]